VCIVCSLQLEERRKLGLVRFSLAMEDMRKLVDQVGFAEHGDDDEDEETDRARAAAALASGEGGEDDDVDQSSSSVDANYTATRTQTHRPSFGEGSTL
jgi:hypothetical protein